MLPLTGEGTGCIRPEQIVLPGAAPLPWLPVFQVRAEEAVLLFLRPESTSRATPVIHSSVDDLGGA